MEWYLKVLKNYATFTGRARRKEYWMFILISGIISAVLGGVSQGMGMPGIIDGIYSLGVLVPTIAVGIRRMHDVDKSGWFLLIPIYGLILAIGEGQANDNRFGPNPKAEAAQAQG